LFPPPDERTNKSAHYSVIRGGERDFPSKSLAALHLQLRWGCACRGTPVQPISAGNLNLIDQWEAASTQKRAVLSLQLFFSSWTTYVRLAGFGKPLTSSPEQPVQRHASSVNSFPSWFLTLAAEEHPERLRCDSSSMNPAFFSCPPGEFSSRDWSDPVPGSPVWSPCLLERITFLSALALFLLCLDNRIQSQIHGFRHGHFFFILLSNRPATRSMTSLGDHSSLNGQLYSGVTNKLFHGLKRGK
ncbi:hypothetical protein V8F06_003797, partial [Rhypophila decipiens]